MKRLIVRLLSVGLVGILLLTPTAVFASGPFIDSFNKITDIASTVPANGDVNPYGVAVVPRSTGRLIKGNVLVSNFNNSANAQGTGTTIVEISPGGKFRLFAHITNQDLKGPCPGGVGLTTSLVIVEDRWVIVGSLPTTDGTAATAQAGCLIVLNNRGHVVETITGPLINGPWDMTTGDLDGDNDGEVLFVSNVLNDTVAQSPNIVNHGSVVRIVLKSEVTHMPTVLSMTMIGFGYGEKTDPAALVVGPTGLALAQNGTLYVADTLYNRVKAIPDALVRPDSVGLGNLISVGGALNSPLGLAMAPNGDILAANGGDRNLVEIAPDGSQVAVKNIDNTGTGAGTLFGLAVAPKGNGIYFVNDGSNKLDLLH